MIGLTKWGKICKLHYGKALRDYHNESSEIDCFRVYGTNGAIGWTSKPLFPSPGIIIGRKGAYRGVHYTQEPFFVIDTAFSLEVTHADVDILWSYYKLLTLDMSRIDVGAAIPTTNREEFYSQPVNVPSLDTQRNIAGILSAYDDLIENNRRRIQLLEESARLLYKEWFVHLRFPSHEHVQIKDGVPEGWEKKKISDVCETIGGGTPSTTKSEYWDGDIIWVVPTDVTRNNCLALLDTERKITTKGLRESSAKMVPPETILMTSRASVGFFAVMDREVCTNQGFISIVPHLDATRIYILFNLMSRVEEIRSNAKGTTYPEITKGRFREMSIVIPTELLVKEFNSIAGELFRQVRCLKKQIAKLVEARDLLLPRLMSGELAV